jgi:phosphatidylserine/phosphatidylglycerophosphate/cardiolipin synthase-like enzyme
MKMNESSYYDLLLKTIKYSDFSEKDKILSLLKRAYITFDKTSNFTRKSWQWYENIEIRILPEFKAELEKHIVKLREWCNEIYEETEEYDIGNIVIKIGASKEKFIIEQEVYFEDLQKQIIEQLQTAEYTIWIAVAWFTDSVLFGELIKKRKEGLNIQIIIIDDEINAKANIDFEKYFETYRIKPDGYFKNILHHKFCIIDFKSVINGSYNWTKKAQYNKETLKIDTNSELAEKFAKEFMKIKKEELI